jgi:SAM-dependent methyltransferase
MNFKLKCFLQHIFSNIPQGEIFNYLIQKYVAKRLPGSNDHFLERVQLAYNHYLKFEKHNSLDENSVKYYEFGAGWDLISPISFALLEFEVTCIDIRKLIFSQLIEDTISKFNNNAEQLPFPINRLDLKDKRHSLIYLKDKFNFTYLAPLDARDTKIDSNYFDFATSSVTLEHIPEQDILLILNESYRILKQGGILSLIIDYRDHWSYFDKSISIYNFLTFSDSEWKKFNPSLHHQNRLRHIDYLNIISKTDFIIMEVVPEFATEAEIKTLENLNIDKKFRSYSINDLSIRASEIVLKK